MAVQYDSLSDLLPNLLSQLPGCPDNLAKQMASRAAREFFSRSEVWTVEDTTGVNVVADQATYVINSDGPELRRVLWLKISGGLIHPTFYDVHTDTNGSITFKANHVPTLSVTNGLTSKVVLVPFMNTDPYASIGSDILDRWHEAIEAKTLERLFAMPRRTWSDPRRQQEERRRYNVELNRAIKTRVTGGTSTSLRARGDFVL